MSGERADNDNTEVADWVKKIPAVCAGYFPEDILTWTRLVIFRQPMNKTFHVKGDNCAASKWYKDRLTFSFCASMAGEKNKALDNLEISENKMFL